MNNFDHRLPAGWKVWSTEGGPESDPLRSGQSRSGQIRSAQEKPKDPRWMRELDLVTGNSPRKTRSIPIGTLAPLLLAAFENHSVWLEDFADDLVVIDADLHDVLLAYQKLVADKSADPVSDHPDAGSTASGEAA